MPRYVFPVAALVIVAATAFAGSALAAPDRLAPRKTAAGGASAEAASGRAALSRAGTSIAGALPSGDAVIRRECGDSEIVIRTTSRLAGAIDSIRCRGHEFINSTDHGRQLQSASNFDCGGRLLAETFNPTEAGSRRDGAGPTSSSRLLHLIAGGDRLQTTTQMAFWLAPGERSGDNPAKNETVLSNHLLTKRVRIGCDDMPHVIRYDATFSLPVGEHHTAAVFEAATGYMPAEFERFWRFNPTTRRLEPLSDGPGEQPWPVVLATADGRFAMGIYSPHRQPKPGYGRFRFVPQKVTKWNCVFRTRSADGIAAGDYSFAMFIPIGDLRTVEAALAELYRKHSGK